MKRNTPLIFVFLAALAGAWPLRPCLGDELPAARLTLAAAETRWRAHNRELRLARTAVDAAEGDRVAAAQRPNPVLSINTSSLDLQRGSGNGNLWNHADTVVRVDQLLERGGKRELRTDAAQRRLEAAHSDLADTLRQQRLALHQAYFDLRFAQERERQAVDNVALAHKALEAAELRQRAGDLPGSEVARIRVDALRTDNDLRQAEAERARAQLALAYLIGAESQARLIEAVDPWPQPAPPSLTDASVDQRADVRAAVARVRAAETARDLAHAQQKRDVTVGAQVERNAGTTYGIGVSFPLMVNYQFQGELRRAAADLDNAREALERVRAAAVTEINRARADLEAAADRAQRARSSLLPEAERSARAAEFAFANGAIGAVDLLDARRTLRAVQLEATQAYVDYAKALAAWRQATATEGSEET